MPAAAKILGGCGDVCADALPRRARGGSRSALRKSRNLVERIAPHSRQNFDRVQQAIQRHSPYGHAVESLCGDHLGVPGLGV